MRLGHVISAYRIHENISIRKFARVLGISHTTLHRFERGDVIDSPAWVRIMRWLLDDKNSGSQVPSRLPADKAKKVNLT